MFWDSFVVWFLFSTGLPDHCLSLWSFLEDKSLAVVVRLIQYSVRPQSIVSIGLLLLSLLKAVFGRDRYLWVQFGAFHSTLIIPHFQRVGLTSLIILWTSSSDGDCDLWTGSALHLHVIFVRQAVSIYYLSFNITLGSCHGFIPQDVSLVNDSCSLRDLVLSRS